MKTIIVGFIVTLFTVSVSAAELTPECQNYLKEADVMFEASLPAAKAQGIDPEKIKAQYEASKAELSNLTIEQQIASCRQAQEMLERVKKLQSEANPQK